MAEVTQRRFLSPLAVGLAIDLAGGRDEPLAWFWTFLVMAVGSVASALAMAWKPKLQARF